ncbi:MAG: hypothetical protein HFP78_06380 [Methylococcales symbiont of Hymedesmia sp. n. MRB-2018]|nr:MAG: hypothetical protein HFP78_06380 [Methylococcales symbiont of Hymedesmia sp. n. MRB-2018]
MSVNPKYSQISAVQVQSLWLILPASLNNPKASSLLLKVMSFSSNLPFSHFSSDEFV